MPLIAIDWNYTPFTPFQAGAAFGASAGALMAAQPQSSAIAEAHANTAQLFAGATQPMFSADFYERWHFSAISFALGNLVGDQTRQIVVWNAHRRSRVLEALTTSGAEGITVSGQPSPPLQFAPLQQRTYDLAISVDGPPVILATITWDFDEGQTVAVTITGSRVTPFPFEPNWDEDVIERLEWLTDVIKAYDGSEQARALRIYPRQQYEFAITLDGAERRRMEAMLWGWGARTFAVPLWHDVIELTAALSAGVTSIPVTVGGRDYRDGTLAMLLGTDSRTLEVVEIQTSNPSELVLARPTVNAWPAGTRLLPARPARFDSAVSIPRFTGKISSGRMVFEMVYPAEYTADAGAASYRSYPVLEARPNWADTYEAMYARKQDIFDGKVGLVSVDDEAKMPEVTQIMRWLFTSRTEVDQFRKLLFALRGKHARIWLPTWTEDIALAATVGSTAVSVDIEWIGYTLYCVNDPNRQDIRIELQSGQILYRRITGSAEVSSTVERLQIDSALGVTVQPGDVAMISFMALGRLDTDAIEFSWLSGNAAESAATTRSFRHDV